MVNSAKYEVQLERGTRCTDAFMRHTLVRRGSGRLKGPAACPVQASTRQAGQTKAARAPQRRTSPK